MCKRTIRKILCVLILFALSGCCNHQRRALASIQRPQLPESGRKEHLRLWRLLKPREGEIPIIIYFNDDGTVEMESIK